MEDPVITIGTIIGIALLSVATAWINTRLAADEKYNLPINPANFTASITNPYFSLPVGRKLVYEQETEDGKERIEALVPGWTRKVFGVETQVSWYRAYYDGELIEDLRDYYAQHKNGDVWYFGEHVDAYEDGKLHDHDSAWIAGVDGAMPGIWMLANPKPAMNSVSNTTKQKPKIFGRSVPSAGRLSCHWVHTRIASRHSIGHRTTKGEVTHIFVKTLVLQHSKSIW